VPDLLPFTAIRYVGTGIPNDISDVCSPPYDVVDADQRAALAARDPHNVVRLVLPDSYAAAAATFARWQREGVLAADPAPGFTVYRMEFTDADGRPAHTTGVIGALRLDDDGQAAQPHERTLPKAKSDRLELLRATRANLEPIWGLSLATGLGALLEPGGPPLAVATDDDGVRHSVWALTAPDRIAAVRDAVGGRTLVLADGHHRYETSRNYRRERAAGGRPDPGADAIMTLVVELAADELSVHAIHRLLHGVAGVDLRAALTDTFTVEDAGAPTADGVAALERAMVRDRALGLVEPGGLALLRPRPELEARLGAEAPELRDVDSARFDHGVRAALPGVELGYRNDAAAVAAVVAKGDADAAVLLRPVGVDAIRAAAAAGVLMPEKTTYFAPKPRSGAVFRSLDLDVDSA